MSIRYACDGCGQSLEAREVRTYGLVRKRDYCVSCAGDVLRFVKARDELHTAIAADWTHRVEVLRKAFRDAHPDGVLPDE